MNKQDFENYLSDYSDCYKSLNGFRPSLAGVTEEEIDSFFSTYDERIEEELERERKAYAASVNALEADVDAAIAAGAGDRWTALYWLFADTVTEGDLDSELFWRGLDIADSNSYGKEIRAAVEEGKRERGLN